MLTGVASVRAYHAEERFILKTEKALDVQNRAYYMTISLQRWLGIRLEFVSGVEVETKGSGAEGRGQRGLGREREDVSLTPLSLPSHRQLGNLLVLGIGLFGVGFRDTVSPGKLGVVLT